MENTSKFGAVADRNLLFGILALQMDFISKEASIAAMSAWVLAKSKPLGQILVEQGALAGDRQALLEALVQEHLKTHNHDAQNEGLCRPLADLRLHLASGSKKGR